MPSLCRAEDIVPAILDDLTSKPEAYVADLIDAVVARYTSWFEVEPGWSRAGLLWFRRPLFRILLRAISRMTRDSAPSGPSQ